jgi:membrane fusion protein (multidrug efflux system)
MGRYLARRAFWAAAAAWALAACEKAPAPAADSRPAPQVLVTTVQPRDIPFSISFTAQTASPRQLNIHARVSGFLDHRPTR